MGLPNILSVFRIALVPVFYIVFTSSVPHSRLIGGGIFLLAALTDLLDGYIARRYNMITKLGRLLDPLADKLLQATALLALYVKGTLPLWPLLVFLLKEILMGIGALAMFKKISDIIPSNLFGKISSFCMICVVVILIIFPVPKNIATYLILCVLSLILVALGIYVGQYVNVIKAKSILDKKNEKENLNLNLKEKEEDFATLASKDMDK